MIAETWDVMTYRDGMDQLDPATLNTVLDAVKAYDPDSYTAADVEAALAHDECTLDDFKALLSPAAEPYIEEMAHKAQAITRARFGNSVSLFTPLYIANYCENGCIYCGFNCSNHIQRNALSREDLIKDGPALGICPSYLDFRTQASKGSMLNTPNTFGIYLCGKVFAWIEATGGLAAMERRNRQKAELLYSILDKSSLFHGTAQPGSRSIANVTFRTGDAELDAAFIAGARERGIEGIGGHRLVGGMRASIYNAVPMESVEALAAYMQEFEAQHTPTARSL